MLSAVLINVDHAGASPFVSALVPGFRPESALERRLLFDPELRQGLMWGRPRPGHPEGPVGRHVSHLIVRVGRRNSYRAELRLLALVHDAFKRRVQPDAPFSPDNDHAVLARRFAERYVSDERVLAVLELHDAPYRIWRRGASEDELEAVLARVPDCELLARFVELDASTPGKDRTFLDWFLRSEALARWRDAGPTRQTA